MAKPKAKTIQQRFGFLDADLKTPKHDELMLWLDQEMKSIVMRNFWHVVGWAEEDIKRLRNRGAEAVTSALGNAQNKKANLIERQSRYVDNHKMALRLSEEAEYAQNEIDFYLSWNLGTKPDPPDGPMRDISVVWEKPIRDRNYIVGFIDLAVKVCMPGLDMRGVDMHNRLYDIEQLPYWDISICNTEERFFFEVKSKIPSLGEVIRQVRMYQEYVNGGSFFIVCPDLAFKDALIAQGIGFVHYPSGEVFK